MSAISQLTNMPKLPISSGLMSAPKAKTPEGYVGVSEIAPALQELGQEEALAQKRVGEADIEIKKAERQEKGAEALKRKELAERMGREARELPERERLAAAREEMSSLSFIPTQDTAKDLAGLFSLMNVIGMIAFKSNAQQAMYAMNGMLEGYQKGRSDLYKRERDTFDKNFKTMQAKVNTLEKQLLEALELKKYDKEAGEQEITVALAQAESPLLTAMKNKQGDIAVLDAVKNMKKNLSTVTDLTNTMQKVADDRQARKEAAAQRERANELAERRLALQEDKLRKGEGGKPLKETEVAKIEGLQSLSKDLQKLKKEFKDEYASLGLLGLGADLSYEAKRRLGDEEGRKAVQWWSKYERLQAPNRHALFGATLTGNELKNYQSFTAKKSDNPQVVRDMIQDQSDYVKGTAEGRALSYESAGYKVPEIKQPRSFTDTYSGSAQAAPAQRPVPTEADRARGRSNPTSRENFIRHFGEEP